jgi:hypothetical protein
MIIKDMDLTAITLSPALELQPAACSPRTPRPPKTPVTESPTPGDDFQLHTLNTYGQ